MTDNNEFSDDLIEFIYNRRKLANPGSSAVFLLLIAKFLNGEVKLPGYILKELTNIFLKAASECSASRSKGLDSLARDLGLKGSNRKKELDSVIFGEVMYHLNREHSLNEATELAAKQLPITQRKIEERFRRTLSLLQECHDGIPENLDIDEETRRQLAICLSLGRYTVKIDGVIHKINYWDEKPKKLRSISDNTDRYNLFMSSLNQLS